MTKARYKPLVTAMAVLAVAWLAAYVGMRLAANAKMTAEKMVESLRATDLESLSATAREKRLQELANKLNSLNRDDRRRARADREWDRLWQQMTEKEKGEFVERTMPTGVKQMLASFEQLPEERRRFAVTNAIARMQREREQGTVPGQDDRGPFSEELQKKMIETGLQTFYAESSAQTKAEVAPLLEEMQRMMQSGRLFRR